MRARLFWLVLMMQPTMSTAEQPNSCHALSNTTQRLECYDKSTGYDYPVAKPQDETTTPLPDGKQWNVDIKGSALDDRKDVYMRVTSDQVQPTGYGNTSHAFLYVRCMKNSTNAFITFDSYTSDNQSVKYRLDDGSTKKIWMETMNGGDGIGIWSGARAIPFIKSLLDKKKLVVAYGSYSNANIEFSFDISGLRAKIEPLATSCSWKY